MMKVQDSGHRPKRQIVQNPSDEQPSAGISYFTSPLGQFLALHNTSLLLNSSIDVQANKYN